MAKLAFGAFGLLIGFIVGLTEAEITQTIIAALFGLIGGKLFIEIHEKTEEQQTLIGSILLLFSVFCIFGIVGGIYTKIQRPLDRIVHNNSQFQSTQPEEIENQASHVSYLKTFVVSKNAEDAYRKDEINCDQLFDSIMHQTRDEYKKNNSCKEFVESLTNLEK